MGSAPRLPPSFVFCGESAEAIVIVYIPTPLPELVARGVHGLNDRELVHTVRALASALRGESAYATQKEAARLAKELFDTHRGPGRPRVCRRLEEGHKTHLLAMKQYGNKVLGELAREIRRAIVQHRKEVRLQSGQRTLTRAEAVRVAKKTAISYFVAEEPGQVLTPEHRALVEKTAERLTLSLDLANKKVRRKKRFA